MNEPAHGSQLAQPWPVPWQFIRKEQTRLCLQICFAISRHVRHSEAPIHAIHLDSLRSHGSIDPSFAYFYHGVEGVRFTQIYRLFNRHCARM